MAGQLPLDLRRAPEHTRARFVVSDVNRAALARLDAPETWHGRALALVGPPGSGKTHLATVWADERGALQAGPAGVQGLEAPRGQPLVWDDADRRADADEALFHLLNRAMAEGAPLLLTGRAPPREWTAALPDLRSRLNALETAELSEPDDAVLAGVLRQLFAERSIRPSDDLIAYLMRRIERSVPHAAEVVSRLDEEAAALHRPVTRALAREVLERSGELFP